MKPVLVRKFIEDEPRIYFDEESWHNSDRSEVRRNQSGLWQRGGCESYMADDEWETLEGSDSQRLEAEYQRLVKAGEVEDIDSIQDRPQWIPVEERLPPLMTEVLGWHPADQVRAWFRHSGTVQGGVRAGTYWEQWSPQDRECDDCEVDEPTHWMPLPEPPEVK